MAQFYRKSVRPSQTQKNNNLLDPSNSLTDSILFFYDFSRLSRDPIYLRDLSGQNRTMKWRNTNLSPIDPQYFSNNTLPSVGPGYSNNKSPAVTTEIWTYPQDGVLTTPSGPSDFKTDSRTCSIFLLIDKTNNNDAYVFDEYSSPENKGTLSVFFDANRLYFDIDGLGSTVYTDVPATGLLSIVCRRWYGVTGDPNNSENYTYYGDILINGQAVWNSGATAGANGIELFLFTNNYSLGGSPVFGSTTYSNGNLLMAGFWNRPLHFLEAVELHRNPLGIYQTKNNYLYSQIIPRGYLDLCLFNDEVQSFPASGDMPLYQYGAGSVTDDCEVVVANKYVEDGCDLFLLLPQTGVLDNYLDIVTFNTNLLDKSIPLTIQAPPEIITPISSGNSRMNLVTFGNTPDTSGVFDRFNLFIKNQYIPHSGGIPLFMDLQGPLPQDKTITLYLEMGPEPLANNQINLYTFGHSDVGVSGASIGALSAYLSSFQDFLANKNITLYLAHDTSELFNHQIPLFLQTAPIRFIEDSAPLTTFGFTPSTFPGQEGEYSSSAANSVFIYTSGSIGSSERNIPLYMPCDTAGQLNESMGLVVYKKNIDELTESMNIALSGIGGIDRSITLFLRPDLDETLSSSMNLRVKSFDATIPGASGGDGIFDFYLQSTIDPANSGIPLYMVGAHYGTTTRAIPLIVQNAAPSTSDVVELYVNNLATTNRMNLRIRGNNQLNSILNPLPNEGYIPIDGGIPIYMHRLPEAEMMMTLRGPGQPDSGVMNLWVQGAYLAASGMEMVMPQVWDIDDNNFRLYSHGY